MDDTGEDYGNDCDACGEVDASTCNCIYQQARAQLAAAREDLKEAVALAASSQKREVEYSDLTSRVTNERDAAREEAGRLREREAARTKALEAYRQDVCRRAAFVGIDAHALSDIVNLLFAALLSNPKEPEDGK